MSNRTRKSVAEAPLTAQSNYQYTYEIDEDDIEGEGKPRRSISCFGKNLEDFNLPPGITNLHDNFLRGVQISADKNYLGARVPQGSGFGPYEWQTYNQIYSRVKNLGSALVNRGFKKDAKIGIFSINRIEWILIEQACYMYSYINVPLYDTLGDEAVNHIIGICEIPIVAATSDKAEFLLQMIDKLPTLKTIILMDNKVTDKIKKFKKGSVEIVKLEELESEGSKSVKDRVVTNPDTIATICFTSGTTGLPKGVVISHGNLLSFVTGALHMAKNQELYNFCSSDVHISYLPLAHIFERVVQTYIIYVGASVGFYQGDTLKLLEDVAELKPTIFVSVPRLFNRIYDKVMAGVKEAGGLSASIFNYAYEAKKYWLQSGYVGHSVWDYVVFGKVREKLGGRVKCMITGAAPISAEVTDFLKICFSIQLIEGYGQTETTAGTCTTIMKDISSGHIGIPMPQCMVKLRDVPSMNYTSNDKPYPRGEICVKGNNVFKGYYKEPLKTAETLSKDGWCYTGDIGYWDEKGRLHIIDRVKNIFKLAQGEYIAPEKIEILYQKHETIAQAFVYGDSLKSSLVAVIVPDVPQFTKWAASQSLIGSTAEILLNEKTKDLYVKLLAQIGKEGGLKGFENVKAVHFDEDPFSVENGLLTPTFKLKRHEAKIKYQGEIDKMYKQIKE
ncbi:Long chain acyl-CoA synthetase 7 peroxisomal [Boothiomyces sp. JEL0866]|nr:Long chain acyl-CoA synthetase 7 peroxisomal [Boothiomyces sp. JEL0866]